MACVRTSLAFLPTYSNHSSFVGHWPLLLHCREIARADPIDIQQIRETPMALSMLWKEFVFVFYFCLFFTINAWMYLSRQPGLLLFVWQYYACHPFPRYLPNCSVTAHRTEYWSSYSIGVNMSGRYLFFFVQLKMTGNCTCNPWGQRLDIITWRLVPTM